MNRSSRYIDASKKVDRTKEYVMVDAIDIVKSTATAKFNESIDIALNLGVDASKSDQMVRGAYVLPHGNGKKVRILVFAEGDKAKEAQEAGADIVGDASFCDEIKKGRNDFDTVIAAPDCMKFVGSIGTILGPRGLMPNPKLGTVTNDISQAVKDARSGMAKFRSEKGGVIHVLIGKKDFSADKLQDNMKSILKEISKLKPSSSKGEFFKKLSISSSMGPSIKIDMAGAR